MKCELDDKITRGQIYNEIIGKTFESQSPDLLQFSEPFMTCVLIIEVLAIIFIILQVIRALVSKD